MDAGLGAVSTALDGQGWSPLSPEAWAGLEVTKAWAGGHSQVQAGLEVTLGALPAAFHNCSNSVSKIKVPQEGGSDLSALGTHGSWGHWRRG